MYNSKSLNVLEAAKSLKAGGVIAIPTETVYGLAANALNPSAVSRVFAIKNRPQFNPIISHFANAEQVFSYTKRNETANSLSKLWPGPLTMLLEHEGRIPLIVTAGSPLAACRVPNQ